MTDPTGDDAVGPSPEPSESCGLANVGDVGSGSSSSLLLLPLFTSTALPPKPRNELATRCAAAGSDSHSKLAASTVAAAAAMPESGFASVAIESPQDDSKS